MDLQQWQARLEALDPQRIQPGLERVAAVYARLDPQLDCRTVVIGGTNGKGSAVAALEALLRAQGARVGAYTSPHLQKFNERVRYQGRDLNDTDLCAAFAVVERAVESCCAAVDLTYFEFTTLAALWALAQKKPDFLLAEVGLGGRLDAVNILDADISAVTGVALDHTEWLGADLESIGFEKAGIYRAGRPAIYAAASPPRSLLRHLTKIGAVPYVRGAEIQMHPAAGELQIEMQLPSDQRIACTVPQSMPPESLLAALAAFHLLGFTLDDAAREHLAAVHLPGRYQRIRIGATDAVLDVAHNPQAAGYLAARLQRDFPAGLAAIFGCLRDKPLPQLCAPLLAPIDHWYLVQPQTPRAATVDSLRSTLLDLGVEPAQIHPIGKISALTPHLPQIPTAAVFGSFYTVGEFLDTFGTNQ